MVKLLHFGWCINTPSHYKDTGVLPNSVDGEEGNLIDFTMKPMVTLKELQNLMAGTEDN